ncbi:MAG: hypothetical protein FJY42_01820 [Betaproteobacteria bacterium]|nr:hypothetical protein [Betaproteobacteria bacterium]
MSEIKQTVRLGALAIAAVWLLVAALLYLGFDAVEQHRQAKLRPYALGSGELVIPRQRDAMVLRPRQPQAAPAAPPR